MPDWKQLEGANGIEYAAEDVETDDEGTQIGGTLLLRIRLDRHFGLSKSEKNLVIATSRGGLRVFPTGGFRLNLNAYRPAPAR